MCISSRLILSTVILTYRFENLLQELHAIHVIRKTRVPIQPSFQPESETAGWLTCKNIIMCILSVLTIELAFQKMKKGLIITTDVGSLSGPSGVGSN